MKICAVICEYNPFHNGHAYLLRKIKELNRFDKILCIMSGCFTQRGEIAILDPYTRGRHAVLGGADGVIALPTVFATSTAERFASGALSILAQIPEVEAIAFGTEHGTKEALIETAKILCSEPDGYKATLKFFLEQGHGYAKAREEAFEKLGYDPSLLRSSNDILAVEYTKAILSRNLPIDLIPIQRIGQDYRDDSIVSSYASASSIRKNANDHEFLKNNLPDFVFDSFDDSKENNIETALMTALNLTSTNDLKEIAEVSEGLENALKADYVSYQDLIENVSGKRYPKTKIQRILLHNLLKITEKDVQNALKIPLYLSVYYIQDKELLSILGKANIPLLTKGRDVLSLNQEARRIREIDVFAEKIFEMCYGKKISKKIFEK